MNYPLYSREERTYGCSWFGVLIALVVVGVIMFGVVFLAGNSIFYIFPSIDPSPIEWGPEQSAAMSAYTITATIIVAVTSMALIGSVLYTRSRQEGSEGQQTPEEYL